MCIGIPLEVISCKDQQALCIHNNTQQWVDCALVGDVKPGQWLLVFLGAARDVISAERAAKITDALAAMNAAIEGDVAAIDLLFDDLVSREPELPPHLKIT